MQNVARQRLWRSTADLLRLQGCLRSVNAPAQLASFNWGRHSSTDAASPPFVNFDNLPCFAASGDRINVLYEPKDFYKYLLDGIKRAKHRIILATLYIGKEQTELVRGTHPSICLQSTRLRLLSCIARLKLCIMRCPKNQSSKCTSW